MSRLITLILCLGFAAPASATTIVSYSSGVTAASGQTGAADPATQGWTFTGPATPNSFAIGYDSGNGGWRTVDGTSSAPANYSQTLDAADQAALTSDPQWTMSWTIALDKDAIGSPSGLVSNYYSSPNNSRQNNIVALIDLAADSIGFSITHTVNSSNVVLLDDGSSTYNTGLTISSFPSFATFSLTYDRGTGTGTLDYGAGTTTVTPGSPLISGRNAVFFGASTSAGQGSAVWNDFSINTIPESSIALLGSIGLLALLRRRR